MNKSLLALAVLAAFAGTASAQNNVTVYGSNSCPDTVRARRYLDDHAIPYEYKDIDESPDLNEHIGAAIGEG